MKIPITPLEKQKELIRYFSREAELSVEKVKALCFDSFNAFWTRDGLPLTKEEATEFLSSLGSVALEIFQKHAAMQDFIQSVDSTWQHLTPPYGLTFKADGSVEIV